MTSIYIRVATGDDVPALQELIERSVRELQDGWYTPEQIEAAVHSVFGVDMQLIDDGTYYVAEVGGQIAGCGGWSKRSTLSWSQPLRSFPSRCAARSGTRSGAHPRILHASRVCAKRRRPGAASALRGRSTTGRLPQHGNGGHAAWRSALYRSWI